MTIGINTEIHGDFMGLTNGMSMGYHCGLKTMKDHDLVGY